MDVRISPKKHALISNQIEQMSDSEYSVFKVGNTSTDTD